MCNLQQQIINLHNRRMNPTNEKQREREQQQPQKYQEEKKFMKTIWCLYECG